MWLDTLVILLVVRLIIMTWCKYVQYIYIYIYTFDNLVISHSAYVECWQRNVNYTFLKLITCFLCDYGFSHSFYVNIINSYYISIYVFLECELSEYLACKSSVFLASKFSVCIYLACKFSIYLECEFSIYLECKFSEYLEYEFSV